MKNNEKEWRLWMCRGRYQLHMQGHEHLIGGLKQAEWDRPDAGPPKCTSISERKTNSSGDQQTLTVVIFRRNMQRLAAWKLWLVLPCWDGMQLLGWYAAARIKYAKGSQALPCAAGS